jgi:hypothetical protein
MLKEAAAKLGGFLEDHPRAMVFLCGGLVAFYAFDLFEASGWFVKAFRAAHEAELAADAARAASEALGG